VNVEEIPQALGVSQDTVMRDWKMVKAWLYQEDKQEGRAPK